MLDLVVEKIDTILGYLFETVENLPGVPGGLAVQEVQFPLHRSESVSHFYKVLGEVRRRRCEGNVD